MSYVNPSGFINKGQQNFTEPCIWQEDIEEVDIYIYTVTPIIRGLT